MQFFRIPRIRFPIALVLATVFGAAFAATPPLPAFSAHYRLLRHGDPIGKATLTLSKNDDGTWTFTTHSQGTSGLAAMLGASTSEKSVFQWVGNLPQCDSYHYTLKMAFKHRERHVSCDWNQHTITVDDHGTHTFATQPGAVERHTVTLALAAGLAAGQHEFNLPVAVRDRIQIQHYVATAHQKVQVPAGTFDTIRVHRTDGGDAFAAWFAPGKLPVPVKINQDGKSGFSLELESWSH